MALSSFFRYSVQGEETVTVREALENLQRYARIIQYRFNGKHRVEVEASREVYLVKIPKMLLQPLVENAVLHGLETKVDGGVVHVAVSGTEQKIVAVVSPDAAPVKRMVQSIKGTRSLIDATQGRKTKAVIVTSDDYLVLSALQPETIARRFAEIYENEDKGETHE